MKSELHKKIREENYAIRFLVYIVGLFIMTLGISLSVKSNLGVSPVSSIPYTITCITGLEMGKATILFHIVLVVMQILILRKAFQMKNLLQVVVGVIFGYFTTFSNYLFSFLPTPEHIVGAAAHDAWKHGTDRSGNLFLPSGRHRAVSRRRSDESSVGYNPYRI